MAEEKPYFFTVDLIKDEYTKTALFSGLVITFVSLYLSRPLFNLRHAIHNRPFLCATSLASATSSYLFFRNTHVYLHYSLSTHDNRTFTLSLLFLLHAAFSLSLPIPMTWIKRAYCDKLLMIMEYTVWFYYFNWKLFDDVATVGAHLSFSLFLVCFLKAAVPGVNPMNLSVVVACGGAGKVLPRFVVVLYALFVYLFNVFISFGY